MDNLLSIENLCLTYQTPEGETQALRDFSLNVKRGEFVSLVGPSGCGKTTVLSLVAGLIEPTSGKIELKSGKKRSGICFSATSFFRGER